ncbi:BgTH12-05059 [Blumeria graminis f. sp. triticale]|uniref:Bgt-2498 n=3 Tax=Blumeria graminis TaxID=34373 RepID=A0A061HSJ6_BLUGR|nr:regulatory subunit of the 26S proteasome [Blumeria graminis f. sp. tritici 96224]CAD6502467.1 BgTH12-05059 [Blumeria graminis f. sp. triticale]VDB87796.1 Bgt-2498 [Blumeria graminis f. sp. tritici]
MGSDPQFAKYPFLPLAQHVFNITNPYASKPVQQASLLSIQNAISEHKMAPLYRYIAHPTEGIFGENNPSLTHDTKGCGRKSSAIGMVASRNSIPKLDLPWNESLYESLKKENDEELEKFKVEEEEAAEKAGDTEVQAARGKKADYLARIGDKDRAIAAYEDVFEKTGVLGTKIDIVLAVVRMGIFYGDKLLIKKQIDRAKALVDSGGDWDRRNRLKAYQGLYLLTVRQYEASAPLLLDSLSTFTSYELCSYSSLVIYSVLVGSVSLKRGHFKSKVVDAPEIKAILGDGRDKISALSGKLSAGPGADDEIKEATPDITSQTAVNLTTLGQDVPEAETSVNFSPLTKLVGGLYAGNYLSFFEALAEVEVEFLRQDRYLYEHRGWFVKEMRLRAYQQLLQSYRVVGLESMAKEFGVTVDYLDRDLAKFIAAQRIPCTIDRVTGSGIIETNRPDNKNKQYSDVVKQGDQLITKLQKYGQAVRLRGSERA